MSKKKSHNKSDEESQLAIERIAENFRRVQEMDALHPRPKVESVSWTDERLPGIYRDELSSAAKKLIGAVSLGGDAVKDADDVVED